MLKKLVVKLFGQYVKTIVLQGVDAAQLTIRLNPGSVDKAKEQICKEITALKFGGDLRKVACWFVRDQDANDVDELLKKLEKVLVKL